MVFSNFDNKHIYVALTCDTEFLPPWYEGTWFDQATWTFAPGIKRLCQVLDRHCIKGTFFTQGTAAEKFPENIMYLAEQGHLIGSHGYNHENYGSDDVKVWTEDRPLFAGDKQRKKELLIKTHNILKSAVGYDPTVFVAPFDNIDEEVLDILNELGYKVDCSFNNYTLGLNSFPSKPLTSLNIVEIPLTVLDFGKLGRKNVLESFTFDFNCSVDKLNRYLEQSRQKHPFDIVLITCHPYEFLQVKTPHPPEVLIVGDKKIDALEKLIVFFKEKLTRFVNPLDIRKKYIENIPVRKT